MEDLQRSRDGGYYICFLNINSMSIEEISECFSEFGNVKKVSSDLGTRVFVSYSTKEEAVTALTQCKNPNVCSLSKPIHKVEGINMSSKQRDPCESGREKEFSVTRVMHATRNQASTVKIVSSLIVKGFDQADFEEVIQLFIPYEPFGVELMPDLESAVVFFPHYFQRDSAILNLQNMKVNGNQLCIKKTVLPEL